MIAKLLPNRVRRSYLGGSRIDAFTGNDDNSTHHLPAPPSTSSLSPLTPNLSPLTSPGAAQPRPEDWLASTTQAFNGTLEIEGEGLGRLEDGRLVKDVIGDLPILVKLLDSDERLVVQTHPTVPCARRLFNSPVGKTECWHFLPGTASDACVYLGFKLGITREAWEMAVGKEMNDARHATSVALDTRHAAGDTRMSQVEVPSRVSRVACCASPPCGADDGLLSLLHRVPVAAGDFIFVDGGVPHAIGGGCFMIELQEPSDLMVVAERFTPSGRRIPDAKMHGGIGWERMFDVYEYDGRTYEDICANYVRRGRGGDGHRLPSPAVECICGPEFIDKFQMWRIVGGGVLPISMTSAVVVVTDGSGRLNGLMVRRGDRLVVTGETSLYAEGGLSAIVCF